MTFYRQLGTVESFCTSEDSRYNMQCTVKYSNYKIKTCIKSIFYIDFFFTKFLLCYENGSNLHYIKICKHSKQNDLFFKGIHCTIHYVVFSIEVQSIENVFTVTQVDKERNVMAYMARSVNHPECPRKDDLVRVDIYCSYMVIKPKTTFSEVQPLDKCTKISASLLSFTNFCLFLKLYLRNNYERIFFFIFTRNLEREVEVLKNKKP